MNDTNYIQQVKKVLSTSSTPVEVVLAISNLALSLASNPLTVLIRGDSQELAQATHYAKADDPAQPDIQQIEALQAKLAATILEKIYKYLADWDAKNLYVYSFKLMAAYEVMNAETIAPQYLEVTQGPIEVATVAAAVDAATQWQSELLERVVFSREYPAGHKLVSVYPAYEIRDMNGRLIASGTVRFRDEEGISTWVNQC